MSKRKCEENFKIGDVVWARIDRTYWPAIIINNIDAGVELAKNGHQWIFWFQDNRISQVTDTHICSFKSNFKKYCKKSVKSTCKIAILQAIRSLESDIDIVQLDDDHLIDWAILEYSKNNNVSTCQLPKYITKILQNIKVKNGLPLFRPVTSDYQKGILDCIKKGKRKLLDICLGCYDLMNTEYLEHPYFDGILCDDCHERVKNTVLVLDEIGNNKYCNICGYSGSKMIKCQNELCNRIYCEICWNDFFDTIENLICICKGATSSSILRQRENWELHVYNMFVNDGMDIPPINTSTLDKGLVVLSLFDGISTGFYVLNALNITVNKYYASEINPIAIELGNRNYNNKITYLGEVEKITSTTLKEIGPIDLLIGGSPCNELSLANPNRKGLYHGTGRLFFEYFRIYKQLKIDNNGNKFFWLYENVASMTNKSKETIDSYLDTEAVLIDSKLFSPQVRKRFYWGNLPSLRQNFVDFGIKLEDYLDNGRTTTNEKLNTITTQSNSMKDSSGIYPVFDGVTTCPLNINELERIFGFPDNYTNLSNLSKTERQKLLGASWSAQTIKMFLSFLSIFYKKP